MDYGVYLSRGVSRNTVATMFVADSVDKLGDSLHRDAVINATYRKHFATRGNVHRSAHRYRRMLGHINTD